MEQFTQPSRRLSCAARTQGGGAGSSEPPRRGPSRRLADSSFGVLPISQWIKVGPLYVILAHNLEQ